mgnify:FL=1
MNAYLIAAAAASVLIARELARDLEQAAADSDYLPAPGDVVTAFADLVNWGGELSQMPDPFESAAVILNPTTYRFDTSSQAQGDRNARAFLDMIAAAEGTAGQPDDGYRTLFGYGRFDSYADHPRIRVPFGSNYSTAAGRYQILARTWDGLVSKLGRGALPDFGPDAQDRAALELIRERGALADVRSGRLTDAVSKGRKVWASLPGANYQGQGMRSMSYLQTAYRNAGGTITL